MLSDDHETPLSGAKAAASWIEATIELYISYVSYRLA